MKRSAKLSRVLKAHRDKIGVRDMIVVFTVSGTRQVRVWDRPYTYVDPDDKQSMATPPHWDNTAGAYSMDTKPGTVYAMPARHLYHAVSTEPEVPSTAIILQFAIEEEVNRTYPQKPVMMLPEAVQENLVWNIRVPKYKDVVEGT